MKIWFCWPRFFVKIQVRMSARLCPSPIFGKGGWSLAWGLFFLRFHPLRTPIWKRLLLHGELTFLTCELFALLLTGLPWGGDWPPRCTVNILRDQKPRAWGFRPPPSTWRALTDQDPFDSRFWSPSISRRQHGVLQDGMGRILGPGAG